MLELYEIGRVFQSGAAAVTALDGITLSFRAKGMAAILGPSGSGKTTFLNIIGGIDQADRGTMIYRGHNTDEFSDKEWDDYRSHRIGFVFQNFNLIGHLTAEENVTLAMMFSGTPFSERKMTAQKVMEQLSILDLAKRRPTDMSYGQQQKVAIARALVTDPEILLCDEPTGSLDNEAGEEIMQLLQKESRRRLVIIVTHNMELADLYADRIISFRQGRVESDSKPFTVHRTKMQMKLHTGKMHLQDALVMGLRELAAARWRTVLALVGCCTGIISLMMAFGLSSGLSGAVSEYEAGIMARFPVIITEEEMNIEDSGDHDVTADSGADAGNSIYLYDPDSLTSSHTNVITKNYIQYIEKIKPDICSMVAFVQPVGMNLIRTDTGGKNIPGTILPQPELSISTAGLKGVELASYPECTADFNKLSETPAADDMTASFDDSYLRKYYDLMDGAYPDGACDLCIVTDHANRVPESVLAGLGMTADGSGEIPFSSLVGMEIKMVHNDDYYMQNPDGTYAARTDYGAMADLEQNITLRITGILKAKSGQNGAVLRSGIVYSSQLAELVSVRAASSKAVIAQRGSNVDILTGAPLDEQGKAEALAHLGGRLIPSEILLYPQNFSGKQDIFDYLDEYNDKDRNDSEKIYYSDLSAQITDTTDQILKEVAAGFKIFAAAAFIVSFIMIFMMTYSEVKESTVKIGLLRALGARRHDISSIVNAGTFSMGLLAGLLGIFMSWLIIHPVDQAVLRAIGIENVLAFNGQRAFYLVLFSILLTLAAGYLPARFASGQDPSEALRRS